MKTVKNRFKTTQAIIGLEIHVELATQSKMFCQCSADHFAKPANTQVCPVCLGLPGALPVPNRKAFDWTVLIAKALNCQIALQTKFDRKHYFYPDLPKGYQISQYDQPIGRDGFLAITQLQDNKVVEKKFRIQRVHLEEDTGKLIHKNNMTLIDFNRSGVPLVEIVTEPDFHDAQDVKAFLEELQVLIRYLRVSAADMEKGSMRFEPNISLKLDASVPGLPDYKVEVKNINSFRFVKQAIEHELERQEKLLLAGERIKQETRGFDSKTQTTYSQRSKENAHDYRYFPEPDIPPIELKQSEIDAVELPERPGEKLQRYMRDYQLRYQDAFILTRDRDLADFFDRLCTQVGESQPDLVDPVQKIANALINKKITTTKTEDFIEDLVKLYTKSEADPKLVAEVVDRVLQEYEKAVNDYKAGRVGALMFLIGQAMREFKGRASADQIKLELEKRLKI